ncbi:MAG: alpha-L-fucosidase [Akkermansiaceae bacterium]|nr:alpha-L-fucosidase [Akkermansiaceae bacterium]
MRRPPVARKCFVSAVAGMTAGALWAAPAQEPSAAPPAASASQPEGEMTREERIGWWREARFGMFIHWGLYAIPGGVWKDTVRATGYSEWVMYAEKIPAQEYALLAKSFKPTRFDAKAWASIAKKAGMKYMVLTTKHHDGFSMFKSRLTPYNVVDATPFKRDVTGELVAACRDSGLRFGCYYSIDRDWYRPQGPGNRYKQSNVWDFPDSKKEDFDTYFATLAKPQIEELLANYRPDLLWFDGIDMKSDAQVEELYQSIRKLRPECVLNSRIQGCRFPAKIPPPHCDYISTGDNEIADQLLGFEWENPASMNTSFGFNRNDHNWVEPKEIVSRLVDIVSKGGNYLLNVGPTPEGLIPQACVDRLLEVGKWLETNGEAIYGTSPWRVFRDGPPPKPGQDQVKEPAAPVEIRFTSKADSLYAICLSWPEPEVLVRALGKQGLSDKTIAGVRMLGSSEEVKWQQTDAGLTLSVPREQPCRHAFVYRIDFNHKQTP